MEIWERNVIKRNLPELINITRCNATLLASLLSADILSDEEQHQIDVTPSYHDKARKLYEILLTRRNAYKLLIKACNTAKQNGVVFILQNGELEHIESEEIHEEISQVKLYSAHSPLNFSTTEPPLAKASYSEIEKTNPTAQLNSNFSGTQYLFQIEDTSMNQFMVVDTAPISGFSSAIRQQRETSTKPNPSLEGTRKFFESSSSGQQHRLISSKKNIRPVAKVVGPTTAARENEKNVSQKGLQDAQPRFRLPREPAVTHDQKLTDLRSQLSSIRINQQDDKGCTILHKALMTGESLNHVKSLIESGADYKMKDNDKEGVLHFAVRGSNTEVISYLMSFEMGINEVDKNFETPLHKIRFTKTRDFLGMTTFLLNLGADFYAKDQHGNTVAHCVSIAENISSDDYQIWVKAIIENLHSSIFSLRGQFGRTPLQAAMKKLDVDFHTMKLVLDSAKIDIDQPDDNGATLLHIALNFGRSLETIKNLIRLGASVKVKDKKGNGVLYLAVVGGNKEVIQYLISIGLDVNEKNNDQFTPLHFVCYTRSKNYFEMTKLLLDNGADLYSKDIDGNTLAHGMAYWEDVSRDDFTTWVAAMVENRLAHLFTVCGQLGRSSLHAAMKRHDLDLETIKMITKSGRLDINKPDDDGNTILHLALQFGRNLNTVKNLVSLGADWKKKGSFDCSVLHSVVEGSNKQAFLYFKSLGAEVNATDRYGQTPLHYVGLTRSKDFLGMTKFLLESGANWNVKDNEGKSFDQLIKADISAEKFLVWKEGMIQLGYSNLFEN